MADKNTVLRYIKIREHAERGVPGEREVARGKLASMEAENPEIRWEAEKLIREEGAPAASTGPDWSTIFSTFQKVYQGAATVTEKATTFVDRMSEVQGGLNLAEHVDADVRVTSAQHVHLIMKMSPTVLAQAKDLNFVQREAFRQALHELLDEQLETVFEALDQEQEEEEDDD